MAGAGYKLFNTGDVLTAAQVNTYLMEQTTMVFADAAARTAALSGVVSEGMISYLKSTKQVEVYNGSAWVASDDPNAIQNTIVDAKGDLIAASANDTPARLAVGSNGDTLLADSSTSTGLRWQPIVSAGKNAVINGAFDIWQRGTSFTNPTSRIYTADRYQAYRFGYQNNITISRQSANLAGFNYNLRIQRTAGDTQTGPFYIDYALETADSLRFTGQTATVSFWAKTGSTSNGFNTLNVNFIWGTTTDQQYSGFSGGGTINNSNATLTTSWQRFSYTGTVGATSTQLALEFTVNPTGTAGANDYIEITGVQMEAGSVATPFSRAGGTLAGELAACQRYYFRNTPGSAYGQHGFGSAYSTTAWQGLVQLPVQMRVTPTSLESANVKIADGANTPLAITLTLVSSQSSPSVASVQSAISGATAFRPYWLQNDNNAAGYVGFSAEL